eukprot:JP436758.1.p2 GENE.JP436758.1~~JP436758.1.p2  ORF type:complete len:213 (-),score=72.91 JP436758.1:67-705(-)
MKLIACVALLGLALAVPVAFQEAQQKVKVALYSEAYCPGCQQFITSTLRETVAAEGLLDIMEFQEVPYGNAHRRSGQVSCQHGARECEANKLEACFIHLYNFTVWFDAFECAETGDPLKLMESCVTKAGGNYAEVQDCYNGSLGDKLIDEAADQTDALSPPHKWVPWLTINDQHVDDIDNLLELVCDTYKGTKPAGCDGNLAKKNSHSVCFA